MNRTETEARLNVKHSNTLEIYRPLGVKDPNPAQEPDVPSNGRYWSEADVEPAFPRDPNAPKTLAQVRAEDKHPTWDIGSDYPPMTRPYGQSGYDASVKQKEDSELIALRMPGRTYLRDNKDGTMTYMAPPAPYLKPKTSPLAISRTRRFWLERGDDVSGVSGTGRVAEGIQFSNGQCAMSWLTAMHSVAVYPNITTLEAIHGHNGATRVVFEEQ